jgi:hypothetical protein
MTQHSDGLDYDLDRKSNYSSKMTKVLMSTAGPANFEKSG